MKGYPLILFREDIHDINPNENLFPVSVRDKLVERSEVHYDDELMDMIYSDEWKQVVKDYDLLTLSQWFTFEELARISYCDPHFFRDTIRRDMEYTPTPRLVQKIQSSFWRWGKTDDATTWNTAVRVFRQIKSFEIPLPNFTATLDWTTGNNERGYSESSCIYLDGVFAYLVHYNDEHVMTIGFSFNDDGDLLIQQVQLAKKKGNRFLYKLGSSYMAWTLGLMKGHFKGRDVYLADGASLVPYICSSYLPRVAYYRSEFSRKRGFLYGCTKEKDREDVMKTLRDLRQKYKAYWKKVIEFRKEDAPRLIKLYSFPETPIKKITSNNLEFGLLP